MEYLKFRGYNLACASTVVSSTNCAGTNVDTRSVASVIENTRTLQVKKEDVETVFVYEPSYFAQTAGEEVSNQLLSWQVNLALKNGGYVQLQVVSQVPVNALAEGSTGAIPTWTNNYAGFDALAVPFNSWVERTLSPDLPINKGTIPRGRVNVCTLIDNYFADPGSSGEMLPVNGKMYTWTEDAIKAYFGIFNSDKARVKAKEVIAQWLRDKVSNALAANPGRPVTEVDLGEVKDFTFDGVTYGGFKLRFGGIGNLCVGNQTQCINGVDTDVHIYGPGLDSQQETGVPGEYFQIGGLYATPFKYNDRKLPQDAGGPPPGPPGA